MEDNLPQSLLEQLMNRVREHLSTAPGCHDFDHTLRVMHNSVKIMDMERQCDRRVVRLAALLHDIARPEEMRSGGKLCHAEAGARIAGEILRKFNMPVELIERVAEAVRRHRYRSDLPPRNIEEQIVYDADKLDSIGCVGIGRAFHFAGRIGARLHNTETDALSSPDYSSNDTAYREYLVKLRSVPERMLTASGRILATERAEFMHQFFQRLNREIYGE